MVVFFEIVDLLRKLKLLTFCPEYLELAAASIKVTNPKCLDILGSGVRALNRIIQQSSYQCGFVPLSGGGNPANPCNVELGTFP